MLLHSDTRGDYRRAVVMWKQYLVLMKLIICLLGFCIRTSAVILNKVMAETNAFLLVVN
jgi:hypothetical protein